MLMFPTAFKSSNEASNPDLLLPVHENRKIRRFTFFGKSTSKVTPSQKPPLTFLSPPTSSPLLNIIDTVILLLCNISKAFSC